MITRDDVLEFISINKDNKETLRIIRDKISEFGESEERKQFLELLNQYSGRSFRRLPKGAGVTLKTFSLEEIERAYQIATVDIWHKDRLKELPIDYLIRCSTIDNLLNKTTQTDKAMIREQKLKELHEANTRNGM